MKVAKERKSSVLEANAVHHRVDSLTGIAALVSIATANLIPSFSGMDAVGGLLISWLVVKAGWSNTRTSLVELADASIDEDIKSKVGRAATSAIEDQRLQPTDVHVRRVQGHKAGQSYMLDLEVAVPSNWTVSQTHDVEDAIRLRIGMKVRGAKRVRVRFVSSESEQNFVEEFISSEATRGSMSEAEEHEHKNGHEHGEAIRTGAASMHDAVSGNGVTKRK